MTLILTKIKSITGRLLSYLFPLIIMILFTGCELLFEDEVLGACERSAITSRGNQIYYCQNDKSEYLCDIVIDDSNHTQLWEDKTCINLGYFYDQGNNIWQADEDNNVKPGAFGRWGDGTASGTEADADNSGASCSEDDYDGPEFDIQIDSQCKLAFIYKCSNHAEGVAAACAIYQVYRNQFPDIPECPYCN